MHTGATEMDVLYLKTQSYTGLIINVQKFFYKLVMCITGGHLKKISPA